MAASTKVMLVLRNNRTGNTRAEVGTLTPSDKQLATWASTGQAHFLTAPEGESVVDIQFNNDGVTTVNNFKILIDGQDIRNNYLMVLFAADSKMPTRLVSPIVIGGNKQVQCQVFA